MKFVIQTLLLVLLVALTNGAAFAQSAAPARQKQPESLSAVEFSRLSRELSEEGGFFPFLRDLQRKNLIVPVVGDFAGKKALAGVGDYLRKYGFTVSAFYTSNVEMVLFQNGIFDAYANNVKKLPTSDRSLIIRAAFSRYSHPARLQGYTTFTLLQQIPVFVKDFDEGRHTSYTELISTNYIAAEKPH